MVCPPKFASRPRRIPTTLHQQRQTKKNKRFNSLFTCSDVKFIVTLFPIRRPGLKDLDLDSPEVNRHTQ